MTFEESKPFVIGQPFKLDNPYRVFPPHANRDWPQILAAIPTGWALRVPVSCSTVISVLVRLVKRKIVGNYEFAPRPTPHGGCIIYHVDPFRGDLFPITAPIRKTIRPLRPNRFTGKIQWDAVLKTAASGRPVTVPTTVIAVRQAVHRFVTAGKLQKRSLRYRKIMRDGEEYVRICRREKK